MRSASDVMADVWHYVTQLSTILTDVWHYVTQLSTILTDVWHWCCVMQLSNVLANYDTAVVWRSFSVFWLTYDTDLVWSNCPSFWLTYYYLTACDTDVVGHLSNVLTDVWHYFGWGSCPIFWLRVTLMLCDTNLANFVIDLLQLEVYKSWLLERKL